MKLTKKLKITLGLSALCSLFVTGCSRPETKTYTDEKPTLTVQEYFNGKVKSYGMFQDWSGKVTQRFTVETKGEWKGNEGTLTESYVYSNGEKISHVWHMRLIDDNHFVGTAEDAVGELQGEQYGNAIHARYRLKIKDGDSTQEVSMDDWMYRIDDHVVLNQVRMKKFGIKIGKFTLSYFK